MRLLMSARIVVLLAACAVYGCGDLVQVECYGDDSDGDGVPDICDVCPGGNDALDSDGDGVPDACDICAGGDDTSDSDGDGVPDACDICAGGSDIIDADGDGLPDECEIAFGAATEPPESGSFGANFLLGHAIQVDKAVTLKSLGVWAKEGGPRSQIAIYSDSDGPSALLASSGGFDLVAGKNEIFVADRALPAGTYWVMGNYDAGAALAKSSTEQPLVHYISHGYGLPPPETWPAESTTYTGIGPFGYFLGAYD